MRRKTSAAGFTLVEVLVVVLIASIVMVVLASVLGSSFEILRTGETRAQLNSNARIALNYICDALRDASGIPISFDRDLNGYPDEDLNFGYDFEAYWRVADWDDNNVPVTITSYWLSEAWGDRVVTSHTSDVVVAGQQVRNRSYAVPKVLRTRPDKVVSEYTSLIRLAIPADNQMPYYLASEWDRDRDGFLTVADLRNSGSGNPAAVGDGLGEIEGYPSVVPVGPYKETAAVVQDLFGYPRDDDNVIRVRQIPIASNITRLKFEYLHEVPVYLSRVAGNDVEIACQDLNDGSIEFVDASWTLTGAMDDKVPLVSHWEMRVIDVAYNAPYTDPETGMNYPSIHWQLQDQYPEGLNDRKRDGSHVSPGTVTGLGHKQGSDWESWTMTRFYTDDEDGENAPIDRLGYVTTSLSGGQAIEGGVAWMRPDMRAVRSLNYYSYSIDPTGRGDLGDADGIPDGDGIPDDPVPGWWLPYLRAVRVTIVATPRNIIEQRRARSGQGAESGAVAYYRLDSPVPYSDPDRLNPQYHLRQDYIGAGRDVVLTKTIPVDYVYSTELVTDPFSAETGNIRRVEHNYGTGSSMMYADPANPDQSIRARTPVEKLLEKNPL